MFYAFYIAGDCLSCSKNNFNQCSGIGIILGFICSEFWLPLYCRYEPMFDYFSEFSENAFRVVVDNYVTDDSGTGIVHCAPAFGEDDYRVCIDNSIISKVCALLSTAGSCVQLDGSQFLFPVFLASMKPEKAGTC